MAPTCEHLASGNYRYMEENIMNARFGVLFGLMVLGLLCAIGTASADNTTGTQGVQLVDDIQAYNGSIGADSSLYGLKIAFENLDDSFTFNQSERLAKEIDHADLRLAELKGALAANRTDAADQALDQYRQNLNQTEGTIEWLNKTWSMPPVNGTPPASIDPVLMNAQEMILRHQLVLENLLSVHTDNPGLARAYDNSRELEQKLEEKTQTQFERYQDADNQIRVRTEYLNPGTGNQMQNETSPVNVGGRFSPAVNRTVFESENGNQMQNETSPVGVGGRSGPAVNMTGSESGNGRQGQAGQTGNTSGQIPHPINQTQQDQHRPVTSVIPVHPTSPSTYPVNRDINNGGTNRQTDNRHDYGNGNSNEMFHTR